MADPVVHFEVPVDDPERAQTFYAQTFGWGVRTMPGMGYALLSTGPVDGHGQPRGAGHINGGMLKRQAFAQHPILTIRVDSVRACLARLRQAGGATVRDAVEVPGVGYTAYFRDPEGNLMGLVGGA